MGFKDTSLELFEKNVVTRKGNPINVEDKVCQKCKTLLQIMNKLHEKNHQ